ncbi:MAG: hypothetical protein MI685_11050 [Chlorobiales bacterium]|nr:hypothetical protein [Chlorobiales bacterium]
MVFKALILQNLYNLSDDQIYNIRSLTVVASWTSRG